MLVLLSGSGLMSLAPGASISTPASTSPFTTSPPASDRCNEQWSTHSLAVHSMHVACLPRTMRRLR